MKVYKNKDVLGKRTEKRMRNKEHNIQKENENKCFDLRFMKRKVKERMIRKKINKLQIKLKARDEDDFK